MDEIWERAVVTALDGEMMLDGAVKCAHGRLPTRLIFEKFQDLHHLSIANIGLASLEQFPRLPNLQKLVLSDNRISGGLKLLVEAGLESLRDLDLSNNRIQDVNDLRPLAELKLVSLDLYECPVTRVKDYRSIVFSLINSLKYLDKMDVDENERPDSDDDDDDEDDPESGEVDREEHEHTCRLNNGNSLGIDVIVDADEDEESDADDEETETLKGTSRSSGVAEEDNDDDDIVDDEDEDDDDYSMDEIDCEDDDDYSMDESHGVDDDDDDVIEVYDAVDNDEEEGIDDEMDVGLLESTGRLTSTEGEIDGHEQGEEDPDDDGETREEHDEGVYFEEDDEDGEEEEEEDYGEGYLIQPVGKAENKVEQGLCKKDEVDAEVQALTPSSKRKRDDKEDDGNDRSEDIEFIISSSSFKSN